MAKRNTTLAVVFLLVGAVFLGLACVPIGIWLIFTYALTGPGPERKPSGLEANASARERMPMDVEAKPTATEAPVRTLEATKLAAAAANKEAPILETRQPGKPLVHRVRFHGISADGKKSPTESKATWSANGSSRTELYKDGKLLSFVVVHRDQPGMMINHGTKTYQRMELWRVEPPLLAYFEKLGDLAGKADRPAEKRMIKNQWTMGFEIDHKKIDPDRESSIVRVWTDAKTKRPVMVELEQRRAAGKGLTMVYDSFEWNVADDNWLKAEAPAEYKENARKPFDSDRATEPIVQALKTYAKLHDGAYPRVKIFHIGAIQQQFADSYEKAKLPDDDYRRAEPGLTQIMILQQHNAGAAYHGQSVTAKDKDKVLLRWQLKENQYRVLYGDLRVEDMDAAKLKVAEKKK